MSQITSIEQCKVGMTVLHPVWQKGEIIATTVKESLRPRISVKFKNHNPLIFFFEKSEGSLITMNLISDLSTDAKPRQKIICLCGSLRVAKEAFKEIEYKAVMRGDIALLPCCMYVDIEREYGLDSDFKENADIQHKRKIDLSDEVFVLNVGGYIGQSTKSEIEYAESIGKVIKYLEPIKPETK